MTIEIPCSLYIARCVNRIESHGLNVDPRANTDQSRRRMEAIEGRNYPVSHPLSSRKHDFTETDSFWLFFTKDGRDVGGVCAKHVNLGQEKFGDYISKALSRQFFPDGDGHVSSVDVTKLSNISGEIVYLGDLFLAEGQRGSAEQVRSIMHLLFTCSLLKWQSLNFIYSFLRNKDVGKGHFYGFTENFPTPLQWSSERDGRSNNEYFAAISKETLLHSIDTWSRQ